MLVYLLMKRLVREWRGLDDRFYPLDIVVYDYGLPSGFDDRLDEFG